MNKEPLSKLYIGKKAANHLPTRQGDGMTNHQCHSYGQMRRRQIAEMARKARKGKQSDDQA